MKISENFKYLVGKKFRGGSILGGAFPVGRGMSKFLVTGVGTLSPSSPVEKTLSPNKEVKNFKPPIWLTSPRGR